MPTPAGHTRAICASKVKGTDIFDLTGSKIGHVDDIVLDKMSDEIMFTIVSFGGFLGIGEKYHALPWANLSYDQDKNGYVVGLSKDILKQAPAYDKDELLKDDGIIQSTSANYYSKYN